MKDMEYRSLVLFLVFCSGNGTTSAVQLLMDCLGLQHIQMNIDTADTDQTTTTTTKNKKPVVFCGPYEHHSNLVPWRESGCDIVMVPERNGQVDLEQLEVLLQRDQQLYSDRPLKLGTFAAASNVTGKVADDDAICATLHKYGALACFDYASAAPYMTMNMNPVSSNNTSSNSNNKYTVEQIAKDAIFFSGHKLLGGIGTPGVLVVKKHLVRSTNPPGRSGGGTVFYVTQTHHRFLSNRIERYEGGTPNVAGIFRLGLCLKAKRDAEQSYRKLAAAVLSSSSNTHNSASANAAPELQVPPTLYDYEVATQVRVSNLLQTIPNFCLLGTDHSSTTTTTTQHLPIFSFLIKCGSRFLHYNYVCAILNDVFGIQSRGGCQCAGPYSQRLLGLTETTKNSDNNGAADVIEMPSIANQQIEHALVHSKERAELLRPGYTRLSLPFKGLDKEQEDYVCQALEWTSRNAWMLLCQYRCNHRTGEWRHKSRQGAPLGKKERQWLSHYELLGTPSTTTTADPNASSQSVSELLQQAMVNADRMLDAAKADHSGITQALKMTEDALGDDDDVLEQLRWYVYPKEVATFLSQGLAAVPGTNDKDHLQGSIRPLAWYPQKENYLPSTSQTTTSPAKEEKAVTPESQPSPNAAPILNATEGPTKYVFREGEHKGEAELEEIEAGFDDGEVTLDCEIYDAAADSWIPIESFLKQQNDNTDPQLPTPSTVPVDMDVDDADPIESLPSAPPVEAKQIVLQEQLALDEKNQKKKPPRDSSTWGQGSFVPVKPAPAASLTNQQPSIAAPANGNAQPEGGKKKRFKHIKPPPKLMRSVTQAMIQWDMVEDGDRLLLGLSGGKDSLSLLHVLLEFQKKLPIKFEIEVCTIDPMTPSFDPSPMIAYVETLGLKYHYIRDDIVERANNSGKDGEMVKSLCAFCARMKRGNLYTCARKNNCNKLVLAQHLDDMAESFMMSVMHNGFLRTMKANYRINAGDLSVIRPLAYCRENVMTEFAKSANLPVINENCPACFEEPKERARIKKLLSREETLFPNFFDNIKRSILPLMHDDATAILRAYTEEALAKSRKENKVKKRPNGSDSRNSKKIKAEPMEDGENDEKKMESIPQPMESDDAKKSTFLADASEDELVRELARRKADRYRLAGSMQKGWVDPEDPTGQVCTLNGGNGSIPCRELME
jgi:tRNA(Ile)-lysidine synthase TilS/MesJ/selenocysteine lyase/cysteine desulfurase